MNTRHRVVEDYYRQRHFDFWSAYQNPFYAATFHLDATRLKAFTDARGYSIYVNLCYFMTRALRGIEDFRYRLVDGRIVLYEEIHPGLTLPAPDGLFTFAYFEYDDDVAAFNERAREVAATARRGVDLGESEHRNWVFFTALPKVPFTSFTHATRSPDDTEPQVAFGRFSERGGRLLVPVGLQVNHRLIDGRALGEAVEGTQRELDAA
jgi:chloramphenicol O-acetyltransferase type A